MLSHSFILPNDIPILQFRSLTMTTPVRKERRNVWDTERELMGSIKKV